MNWKVGVGWFESTPTIEMYVNHVLKNGRLSYGPFSRRLERNFADLHGAKFGVLSNSGTSSLHVALQAMKEHYGWEDGDEVIVPALTFVATVNVVLHNRLKPVLVDVDWRTFNIDPKKLEAAITDRTRCVIPVHLFGQCADMNGVYSNIPAQVRVMEDSCETVLARYRNGGYCGALSEIGCFSFYIAHILTAGVGGISLTNDEMLARKMRSLVNHGRVIEAGGNIDIKPTEWIRQRRFQFETVGHSFRITELEAAVACAQLDDLKKNIEHRNWVAQQLIVGLRQYEDLQLPFTLKGNEHSFMMFPMLYRGNKWALCNHLEKRGIETREMLPLTNQPVYSGLFKEDDYPVAKRVNQHGFYIGSHPGMGYAEVSLVLSAFEEYFN